MHACILAWSLGVCISETIADISNAYATRLGRAVHNANYEHYGVTTGAPNRWINTAFSLIKLSHTLIA